MLVLYAVKKMDFSKTVLPIFTKIAVTWIWWSLPFGAQEMGLKPVKIVPLKFFFTPENLVHSYL